MPEKLGLLQHVDFEFWQPHQAARAMPVRYATALLGIWYL